MQHRGDGKEVGDVEAADQPRVDLRRAGRRDQAEGEPGAGGDHVLGADPFAELRRRRARGGRLCIADDAPGRAARRQFAAEGIVHVDDRQAQAGPAEEFFLGRGVRGNRSVVVEMVAGQVGEHRDVHLRAVETPLLDTDRTRLQRAGRRARAGKIGQRARQRRRLRRGETGVDEAAGQADAERADDATGRRIGMGEPLADAGLAVGAGDRDQRQAFGRAAADRVRQGTCQRTQAAHRDVGNVGNRHRRGPDEAVGGLPDDGDGAAPDGIGDKVAAVGEVAGIGEEEVAGAHAAAVVGSATGDDALGCQCRQDGGGCPVQVAGTDLGAAHNASRCVPARAISCCGASGGTPSVRSALPITAENTGPATLPP